MEDYSKKPLGDLINELITTKLNLKNPSFFDPSREVPKIDAMVAELNRRDPR